MILLGSAGGLEKKLHCRAASSLPIVYMTGTEADDLQNFSLSNALWAKLADTSSCLGSDFSTTDDGLVYFLIVRGAENWVDYA